MDITPCGFPHSEICGSKAICASPQLIAACHVLLRRLVPRHPPCALSCLTFASILPDTLSLIMSLQRFSLAVCPLLSFFELSGIFLCSYHLAEIVFASAFIIFYLVVSLLTAAFSFFISLFSSQGTFRLSRKLSLPLVGSSGVEPPTSRLSGARSNHLSYEPVYPSKRLLSDSLLRLQKSRSRGGDEQIRTVDPLRAKQVLSQLSYTPLSLRGFLLGSVLTILSRSERYLVN